MTVYSQVLGQVGLAALSQECRAFHAGFGSFRGEMTVQVTGNPLTRWLLRLAGVPLGVVAAPLDFEKTDLGTSERWERRISGQNMTKVQWRTRDGRLAERLGLMTAISRLQPSEGGLDLTDWRFRFMGVPVPRWAAPHVTATERPEAGRYGFRIAIAPPWGGAPVVQYHGWLETLAR